MLCDMVVSKPFVSMRPVLDDDTLIVRADERLNVLEITRLDPKLFDGLVNVRPPVAAPRPVSAFTCRWPSNEVPPMTVPPE